MVFVSFPSSPDECISIFLTTLCFLESCNISLSYTHSHTLPHTRCVFLNFRLTTTQTNVLEQNHHLLYYRENKLINHFHWLWLAMHYLDLSVAKTWWSLSIFYSIVHSKWNFTVYKMIHCILIKTLLKMLLYGSLSISHLHSAVSENYYIYFISSLKYIWSIQFDMGFLHLLIFFLGGVSIVHITFELVDFFISK